MTAPITRREFVIRLSALLAAGTSGAVLSACSDHNGDDTRSPRFAYGVASGDPLADRVILWTHARYPDRNDDVPLRWEVAEQPDFGQIVASGTALASASRNHTVHVDAGGLQAGKRYCYRFVHDAGEHATAERSAVGWTRTLPADGATEVSFVVLSCSNYPAGYFHAYGEAARADAQYALHLGDFIYEYGPGGYASADAERLNRVVNPRRLCTTLDDYRERYAQYRSDPHCKELSAALPMIAIWDDHEIADNLWRDGSLEHDESTAGSFAQRRDAALQAWHEWLPVRAPDPANLQKTYRSFDFGGLLALHMLETRVLGRDRQIELQQLQDPASAVTSLAALASPTRTMLGSEQRNWLMQQLTDSQATWQILGQQVLMARMTFPVSILSHFGASTPSPDALATAMQAVESFLQAQATAARQPDALTEAQRALLDSTRNPRLGYNMDAWDGYPAERELLLTTARTLNRKLVVLAGDTHNAWGSQLTTMDGTVVGFEYGTTSISSPGMEAHEFLSAIPPAQTQQIFLNVVKDLQYADTARRGYLLLKVTPAEVQGQWCYVSTVKEAAYTLERSAPLAYRA